MQLHAEAAMQRCWRQSCCSGQTLCQRRSRLAQELQGCVDVAAGVQLPSQLPQRVAAGLLIKQNMLQIALVKAEVDNSVYCCVNADLGVGLWLSG